MRTAYRRFGFLTPNRIDNWPAALPPPELALPLGSNVATAKRLIPPLAVTLSNLGCASCHSSIRYSSNGSPDIDGAWIGGSNSSIHPEAYLQALDTALKRFEEDERLDQGIKRLHPDLSWREQLTLKWFVRPALKRRVSDLRARFGRLTAYPISVPGATNGLDSLKQRLGLLNTETTVPLSVFNSVPELGCRLWRTKLLNSGSYVINGRDPERTIRSSDITHQHLSELAGVAAFLIMPTMGVTPEIAASKIDETEAIMLWLRGYEAQPFPGEVDRELAESGQGIYSMQCASCHGRYDQNLHRPSLISFPKVRASMGTESLTAELFTARVAKRVESTVFDQYFDTAISSNYRAAPLTGLWASAPYLHNGSVPTLWHLMHPEKRPDSFLVGGHALDFDLLGVRGELRPDMRQGYPLGYAPWSTSAWIDTTVPGFGNEGHEAPFDQLDEADKGALIEYLKLL